MATLSIRPGSRNLPPHLTITDTSFHSGGEGTTYLTPDGQYVVKIYHNPRPDKQELLQKVLDLGKQLGEHDRILAWPQGIVASRDGQPVIGVITRFVPYPELV